MRPSRILRFLALLPAISLFSCICCNAYAAGMPPATIPSSDAEVLETVPTSSDIAVRDARALRGKIDANPDDLATTLELSRRYVDLARRDADPRYIGYAEALLTPWLSKPAATADVKVMYAIVLQATHRFEPAVAMLQQAIKQNPATPQAWLTLASIKQVQGDFAAARSACLGLATTLDAGVATRCVQGLDLFGAQAPSAYAKLSDALRKGMVADWERNALRVELAEAAARAGNDKDASDWFSQAMRAGADSYLKAAYADYLLDHGKYAEVITMLRNDQRADPLLLRLAEAARGAGSSETARYVAALAARFDAARERGDITHLREESRFELRLRGNTTRALDLAKRNWEIQREPADLRVLLEAADKARDRTALQQGLAWIQKTGLMDTSIQPLLLRAQAIK